MIREDIAKLLTNSDPDKIFLQHRDSIDQDCYRVGLINDEIICWNPKTNKFMDYFYDDQPDRVLFSLGLIREGYDRYTLNRSELSITGPHGKLTIFNKKDSTYPSVHTSIRDDSGKVISYNFDIHRIIALLFIPRYYENYTLVDHINRDKTDYRINNLRWVDHRLNSLNQDRKLFLGNNIYIASSTKDRVDSTLVFKLTEKEMYDKYHKTNPDYKARVRISVNRDIRFDKLYWSIENLDIENYLQGDIVDESLWVEHFSKKMYVHPLGLIKIKNKKSLGYITIGSIKGTGSYKIRIFKRFYVHRLVAEVFLNDNKPLKTEQVVDHLDGNSLNNRLNNLRVGTQKDNVNNPNYGNKANRKTPIEIDGIRYESFVDASEKLNISRTRVRYRVLSKNYSNYKFV